MKKRILITGATGHIGSRLTAKLLSKNYLVNILVRDTSKIPLNIKNHQNLTVITADLDNIHLIEKSIIGVDTIFHLAAALNPFEKNKLLYRTNILGTKNLISVCQKQKTPIKIIFASSIDVISKNSDYARSKLSGEEIIINSAKNSSQINFIIVRIGNVYDSDQSGMINSIANIVNHNNWQSSTLLHSLGQKHLYLIKLKQLIIQLESFIDNDKLTNQTITLIDETITVKDLLKRLKHQGIIKSYPKKSPLSPIIFLFWQILGRILKKCDLLIYLNLEK